MTQHETSATEGSVAWTGQPALKRPASVTIAVLMAWGGLLVQLLVSAYLGLLAGGTGQDGTWTTEEWLVYEGLPARDAAFVQMVQDASATGGMAVLVACAVAMLAARYAINGISRVGRWPVVGLAALAVALYLLALALSGSYWPLVPVLWIAVSGGLLLTPRADAWYQAKTASRPQRQRIGLGS